MATVARRRPARQVFRAVAWAGFFYVALTVFVLTVVAPLYYIFLSAVQPQGDMFTIPLHYWPTRITSEHFERVLRSIPFTRYMWNTTGLSLASSLVTLAVSLPAAYAFARISFPGSSVMLMGLLASGMLPGIATIIPLFDLYMRVGLVDNLIGLGILYVSAHLTITIWALVSFFKQVPAEVEEAAMIDGASTSQLLLQVVLPLLRPGIATMFIINFILNWNEFFLPLVFARDAATKTVTLGISEAAYLDEYHRAWENIAVMGILVVGPVFALALFFQRQIVEGLLAGALKG